MSNTKNIDFGFVATAVGAPGITDAEGYRGLMGDCEHNLGLGYSTIWMIEHHFSDYFPTPNPMGMLMNLAARFPEAALGTCVVVTPWHNALRFAEDVNQLAMLTDKPLHIGMGRGVAKAEYDAFSIEMDEAQTRFREIWDVVQHGMSGEKFSYDGEYIKVPKEVVLRPVLEQGRADTINFYGAIGSPDTAVRMADMGLPPMCTTIGNFESQAQTITNWRNQAIKNGLPVERFRIPIMVNAIVADTDEEAIEETKQWLPPFMQAQVDHYEGDKDNWQYLETYKAWSKIFAGMKDRCKPEAMPKWSEQQFVGSAETVIGRVQAYIDAGFDTFLVHTATPGVPNEPRRRWCRRFAEEVMPAFSGQVEVGLKLAS